MSQSSGLGSRRAARMAAWICALAPLLTACDGPAVAPAPPPPPEVGVIQVTPRTQPLTFEVIGDIRAYQEVELRPRVSGVVEKQLFRPGQMVKQGAPLFVIDTRSLDSAIAEAQSGVLEAEAALQRARQDVARYEPLLPDNAIPRQTYDQAVASEQQNAVGGSGAARRTGARAARSLVCRGALADLRADRAAEARSRRIGHGRTNGAGDRVSTLDPVVAYFSIAEVDYLNLAKRFMQERKEGKGEDKSPIELILADGSVYGEAGAIDFTDRALNAATGTLTLRAVFPNPSGLLRPGMNTRVRIVYEVAQDALLIPQKAVTELLGKSVRRRRRRRRQDRTAAGHDRSAARRTVAGAERAQGRRAHRRRGRAEGAGRAVVVKALPLAAGPRQRPCVGTSRRRQAMARFFIDRPVFAIVTAIVMTHRPAPSPASTCRSRSIPQITLPTIRVATAYPGRQCRSRGAARWRSRSRNRSTASRACSTCTSQFGEQRRLCARRHLRSGPTTPTSPRCRCRTASSQANARLPSGGAVARASRPRSSTPDTC
jgi:membrane fusion protein (multidrug efflux system)